MKRKVFRKGLLWATGLFMLSSVLPVYATTDTLHLTLDDALRIALSENPTVKVADKEIERQEYAKKGTYASLFPNINFSADYQRAIKKQVMYMDMDMSALEGLGGLEGMGDMPDGIEVGRDNTWSLGFNATMPIVSATLWKSLKISGYDVELAVEKARSSRIEMTNQVQQSFYSVLLANDTYRVFRQTYDNAVKNHAEIKEKYERGLQSEYDLIRANVNVKNAEPNMYDAQNALLLAQWQLKALMGIDLETDIRCVGTLSEYEKNLYADYLSTDTILTGNSDLKQLDIQYSQLKKVQELRKAEYLPTLNLAFNYSWTSMNNNFKFSDYKWNPYSMLGVSLTVPIFSGGKRLSDVRQATINLQQVSLQRQDLERNLRLAIKKSNDEMQTCLLQYKAAREGVGQAEKGYMISVKRYETGDGTLLEINDSQLSLTQAQLNLNQSVYNYLIAKSSLDKTLGKDFSK